MFNTDTNYIVHAINSVTSFLGGGGDSFDLRLVKSLSAEAEDTEGQLYIH